MNNMQPTIVPKSDQMNADDLIAGPRTITIRNVNIAPGTEQPVAVFFDEDEGKPYLPCKSMRRVMVALWGPDASVYSRRAMTLYRDPTVTWGGMEVGGIRISHMSHIDKTTVVVLTATKKSRKPFTVSPLATPSTTSAAGPPLATPQGKARAAADRLIAKIAACETEDELHEIVGNSNVQRGRDVIKRDFPDADEEIARAITAQGHELNMGSAAEPVT
jgi:hypothetical protein